MTEKRFSTNGYYIYDSFKENKWLVNEVEANEIVNMLNKLDTKARERSKALSTLQKKFNELKEENEMLKIVVTPDFTIECDNGHINLRLEK